MSELQPGNPYVVPRAPLADQLNEEAFADVRFWGASGRMGRLYFLSYGIVAPYVLFFALMIVAGILGGVLGLLGGGASKAALALVILLVAAGYIGMLWLYCMSGVKRLHDINLSGWLLLLLLVPLVNFVFGLVLLFAPGTKAANNYGPRPRPAPTVLWVLAIIGFFVFFVAITGVVAAIALPAYKQYSDRLRAREAAYRQEQTPDRTEAVPAASASEP